jgi:hypothetical protein
LDQAYQRLAVEVAAAGGHLELAPEVLSARLHMPVDAGDAYTGYLLKRRLSEVGLTAEFPGDGSVLLAQTASVVPVPSTPSPPAAAPRVEANPAGATPGAPPLPTNPEPPAPPVAGSAGTALSTEPTAEQVGNWLYGVLVLACTFVPAIGHALAPGGDVGDKKDAFFAIYFATFPLSLAATFIFLMLFFAWFDNDKQRAVAAGVAIVLSAVWGIGFGSSYADLSAISHLHGNLVAVAIQVVALALFAYATYYGLALFLAGWASSLFAALWIREKVRKVQALRS